MNAHAHLQLEPLARPVRSFVPWLRAVIADRSRRSLDDLERAAERALESDSLCRSIGEVDSTGASRSALARARTRGRLYRELLGFDLDSRAARALVRGTDTPATRRCPRGLSPHAPYSVSSPLLRAAVRTRRPLMVHVAESPEEVEFQATGRGPFRELLEDLDRLPRDFRPRRESSVEWLARHRALSPRTALVHCQHISDGDLALIVDARAPVVVCPGTIRYFRRRPPPLEEWIRAGVRFALGTDSRASHDGDATIVGELVTARRLWPNVEPERLLTGITAAAGRAIARPDLGVLRVGGPADFVGVAWSGPTTAETLFDGLASGSVECRAFPRDPR
ncbi:MAG: amidohydrolase family protein [Planctomycetes bacterium]|nr:amidohydrolase family protein [Planctomycetota bacterium]